MKDNKKMNKKAVAIYGLLTNWKVPGENQNEFRADVASFILARDVITDVAKKNGETVKNYSAIVATDYSDMMKLARGERTYRSPEKVRESYDDARARLATARKEAEAAEADAAAGKAGMIARYHDFDTVFIKKDGNGFKEVTPETKGAVEVSRIFAGYLSMVIYNDHTPYNSAIADFIRAQGFTPEAGTVDYLKIGGVRENKGASYAKAAKNDERVFCRPVYAISENGAAAFMNVWLNRLVQAVDNTHAAPVGRAKFEYFKNKSEK